MTISEILTWMLDKRLDLFTLVAFILFAGYKRWWVWGYQLDDQKSQCEKMEKDRDLYRDRVFRAQDFADRAVNLLEKQP